MSFVTALKLELQQIEADLHNDPRFRRAQRIRELLADYEGKADLRAVISGPTPGKFERIRVELNRLMKDGGYIHRKALLDHLLALGLMGTEKNPMASLAHYLTTSGHYKNNNNGSWALK